MARIRSLKPEFWDDRKLARQLSRDARMLYMGLWNQADEHARCNGDPSWVKGRVFPFDDDLTDKRVAELLDDLAAAGRVVPYMVEGDPYLFLPKLPEHQRLEPKVDSRLPPPPDPLPTHTDSPQSASDTDKSTSDADQTAPHADDSASGTDEPASDADDSALLYVAGSREHGAGSRGRARARASHAPDDLLITDAMRAWAQTHAVGVDLDRETQRFLDHHRAKGNAFKDWHAAWRNWMSRAVDWGPRQPAGGTVGHGGNTYGEPPPEWITQAKNVVAAFTDAAGMPGPECREPAVRAARQMCAEAREKRWRIPEPLLAVARDGAA